MLDLSDVVQWYAYWAFASPSHDTLEAICKPGDTAIDVGANVGLTTLRLARGVGPTGRVIALEPSADQLDRCRYHVTANSIAHATLRGKAASDTVGAAHLRALDSGNSGRTVLADSGTPVETTTIDALVAEERLQRVDVVKIDVEGHEARVLHGAEETIRRFLPSMHIEVNDEHLRDSGDTAEMLLDELSALGYRLYDAATGASLGQLARLPPHMDIVAFSARR